MENPKAAALIEWFQGRKLPECPFRMEPCFIMEDVEKFVSTNISTMIAAEPRVRLVGKAVFINCYQRLFHLKQYIEQHGKATGKDNNIPEPL